MWSFSFSFPPLNLAVQLLFPFRIPTGFLAALVLGLDPVCLAYSPDIIGGLGLVAGLVCWPEIVVAVIAG
jgi:hypothetical protein